MIEVESIFQQREFMEDRFGDGTFGYTEIGKSDITTLLTTFKNSNLKLKLIIETPRKKTITGTAKAKHSWSKAQGGTRNVFFDPDLRDDSIAVITNSIIDIASQATGNSNPVLEIESDLITALESGIDLNLISNINIICN